MTRDPIRFNADYGSRDERPGAPLWRPLLARCLALSCLLSLGVAVVGAAVAPLSLVPQLSFGAAVVLMFAGCWLAEGGPSC